MPGMAAVVSSLKMCCGYTAFPIVYFSAIPPRELSLSQTWAEKEYRFDMAQGERGWDIVEEVYDYVLQPWVDKGLVRWIVDDELSDPADTARRYPFGEVPGHARPQILLNDELRFAAADHRNKSRE